VFLGRHLVDAAHGRGHEVTVFTRGQHEAELPPDVERMRGDRDGCLGALRGRRWDAVVETSGYVPRVVRASADLLAPAAGRYLFVSTISVYDERHMTAGLDETFPLATLADERVEEVTNETYGALKALCERAVTEVLRDCAVVVRPGLIVGPYDPTDRFTYWPHRVARGGRVLAPGVQEQAVLFFVGRDLAAWIVRLAEEDRTGVFNATGPDRVLPMREVLETCRAVGGGDAELVWVEEEFLLREGVGPWIELPLWVPRAEAAMMGAVNVGRALAAGLTFRPLADTVRDTLAWDATRPPEREWRAGLAPAREAELLAAWAGRAP
jgi:2'-hydroxyisoflavone reductase